MKNNYLTISIFGPNNKGLLYAISDITANSGCNIENTKMNLLGSEFVMYLMVSGSWDKIAKIETQLPKLKRKYKVTVILKRTQSNNHTHYLPYTLNIVAKDNAGILKEVSNFISEQDLTMYEIIGERYIVKNGVAMSSLAIRIGLPCNQSLSDMRDEFLVFCDEQNLDGVMEPDKY